MTFQVENKNVLVTGANRGIGRAIVEGALQRGAAKVYAAVRQLDTADSLVAEYGDRVVPVHLDLNDPSSIAEPPSLVADAIFDSLENDRFHVWPDSMAKQIAEPYQAFAESVVEAEMQEGPA